MPLLTVAVNAEIAMTPAKAGIVLGPEMAWLPQSRLKAGLRQRLGDLGAEATLTSKTTAITTSL